jgi:hypothetical protein
VQAFLAMVAFGLALLAYRLTGGARRRIRA